MKKPEKTRITEHLKSAVADLEVTGPEIRDRINRVAARFSPTNAEVFRELSELVWWLIAVNASADAMRIMSVLCEIDDDYYWMFDGLSSAFATRAWLHAQHGESAKSADDVEMVSKWLERDPNRSLPDSTEVEENLKRFQDWLDSADNQSGDISAAHDLSHALRVLVIYQQLAQGGLQSARVVSSADYSERINTALSKLRDRIHNLESS